LRSYPLSRRWSRRARCGLRRASRRAPWIWGQATRTLPDVISKTRSICYLETGAPFELGRARIELARALVALGRVQDARQEAQRALVLLSELHAELEMSRARAFLESLPQEGATAAKSHSENDAGLTKREVEVLRLVADGLNNQVIADTLFVSEHTIHRHVANIFSKLSVSSRAAAVAQAARRGLL
jgi:LuxR family transcriptional regulator, maltose regulon positive regulatory protein